MRIIQPGLHSPRLSLALLCAAVLALAPAGASHGEDAGTGPHERHDGGGEMHHGKHAAHGPGYTRGLRQVLVPDLALESARAGEVSLRELAESDELVLLNFIFTSCTTICPVLTATFSAARDQLDNQGESYRMISISIDPEHDTPGRLAEYATRHQIHPQWLFLTGDQGSITSVQKAFDIYRGNKMNHVPVVFLRGSRTGPWLRIDGFPAASELVREARRLAVK